MGRASTSEVTLGLLRMGWAASGYVRSCGVMFDRLE